MKENENNNRTVWLVLSHSEPLEREWQAEAVNNPLKSVKGEKINCEIDSRDLQKLPKALTTFQKPLEHKKWITKLWIS